VGDTIDGQMGNMIYVVDFRQRPNSTHDMGLRLDSLACGKVSILASRLCFQTMASGYVSRLWQVVRFPDCGKWLGYQSVASGYVSRLWKVVRFPD